MPRFKVKGTIEISHLLDIEDIVSAENQAEAVMIVQDAIPIDGPQNERCMWRNGGPEIEEIADDSRRGEDVGDVPW